MSGKNLSRLVSPPPTPPKTQDPGVQQYLQDASIWMETVMRAHNYLLDAILREDESGYYPGRKVGTGQPTDAYLVFNAKRDTGNVWRKIDKAINSWAFRFDNTTNKFDLLYAGAGMDPIVWATHLSTNNTGVPENSADIVRLVDLSGTDLFSHMQTLPGVTDLRRRLKDLELKMSMQGVPRDLKQRIEDLEIQVAEMSRGVSHAEVKKQIDSLGVAVWMGG